MFIKAVLNLYKMDKAIIDINKNSFEGILRSAYETLKRECAGVLFGENAEKKSGLIYHVESVHPIQLAKRFPKSIEYDEDTLKRAEWGLFNECIGGYHLHPASIRPKDEMQGIYHKRVCLSDADSESVKDGKIEIVISLRKVKKEGKLKNENPFLVSGYIKDGSIYRFDIGGYYRNGRIRRAEIKVPKSILRMAI